MEISPRNLDLVDRDGYLEARALGSYSLDRMKSQLEQAVAACLKRNAEGLLFDITEIEGYRPTTAERYQIGSHIAQLIRSGLGRFACLAKVEQIDRENFTSQVATNRGRPAPVFNNREEAVAWILEQPPASR